MLAGKLCCSLVIDHGVGAVLELAIEVEGSAEPQVGVDEFDFRTEDLEDVLVQERSDSRRVRLDLSLHRLPPCYLLCRPVQLRTELCGASWHLVGILPPDPVPPVVQIGLLDHPENLRNRGDLPPPRRVEAEARSRSGVDPQSEISSKSDSSIPISSSCFGLPLPFFTGRSLRMKFRGEPSESSPSSTNTSQRRPANSSVSNSRSPKSCFAHLT